MLNVFFKLVFCICFLFVFLKIAISSNFLFNFFTKKPEIQKKIQELQYQKSLFEAKSFEFEELKKENSLLKEALDIKEKFQKKIILANVIGASPFNLNPVFLIDKGKKDGIEKGDIVLLNKKIVIGKIKEVKENFSRVSTFFDKENSITVTLKNRDLVGTIKAKNQNIFLDLIPKNTSLKEGEALYSSGFDFKYPRGLLVGEIKKIETKEDLPFLEIEIKLPYKWYQITQVLVMKK